MNFYVLLSLYFALNTSILCKRQKIIGGTVADIKDFPFLSSLRNLTTNKHFCGGSIITKRHILTAAHCLFEKDYSIIRIYVGSNYSVSIYSEGYDIESVRIHPHFTGYNSPGKGSRHDIAIITLNKEIEFNVHQKNGIIQADDVKVEVNAEILGWGLIIFPSKVYSMVLRKASVKIIKNTKCLEKIHLPIYDEHICSDGNTKFGVCLADSGGPLIIEDKIVGIASFCIPCARGFPDVFTRVYNYLNFIRTAVNANYQLNISVA
ncbi:PREDICTED: chymotrypsin-2-like [Ceratosolen solmsi marchali]|uniref:Chymotrypsin-2-like n=1 Tax=Ceratosolen solmsi marchali TaxID=326594 RepID=A0AAJ6VKN8_9HYME|nr:PREDICTED: chymotrypsin-2-like [Ceratosolen solmsi marchali]